MTDKLLNQDEIDVLLGDNSQESEEVEILSDIEKDALGEIGNISMGTAATTLFTLLGQKVTITTPRVTVTTIKELGELYNIPFVAIDVRYKMGLEGMNLLIMKIEDVKIIADLMMGGEGRDVSGDITEIDLSAIGEAMNQMVGSGCTSLSEMFGTMIDIEPPRSFEISLQDNKLDIFESEEKIVKVSFRMVVGDLIDSEMMQLIPLNFAQEMVTKLLKADGDKIESNKSEGANMNNNDNEIKNKTEYKEVSSGNMQNIAQNSEIHRKMQQETVTVKNLEFEQFENIEEPKYNESIDIIQEIPVEITVQLGRTMRKIGEILEYGPGTIIELDKVLGEPLDVFANGKFIAKGEVVVIEDNFGVRITEIVSPSKRINRK
ncbi:flagellar motor switch phosphatase FliY [Gottschalkia purinilytica]|nr:flagellar motor switch phosphatase FliY [Gottschalkia purinilytica]